MIVGSPGPSFVFGKEVQVSCQSVESYFPQLRVGSLLLTVNLSMELVHMTGWRAVGDGGSLLVSKCVAWLFSHASK